MMQKSSIRAIVNTGVQYVRSLISIVILLYSSRLILSGLGVEDFGLYSLIFGIVSMLSFIKDSLSQTIQRYLSFYQGCGDFKKQCDILSNSRIIQLILSLLLILVLFILKNYILNDFLNIDLDRLDNAHFVYICMLFMLFFTMQSAPYFAVLIAHENILYTSFVQLLEVVLKLIVAIYIDFISYDKLSFYALCMAVIPMFSFFSYSLYSRFKYNELSHSSLFSLNVKMFKEMFLFMGWNIYSVGCIVGRTQGIAVLLNRFYGVAVNASYGIAQQVSGQMSFLSVSLLNAMQPQIVKAEGRGDRCKMFLLSETTSKFAFLLISFVSIPTMFYMDKILLLWLGNIPEYAEMACRYILLSVCLDQLTMGLGVANKAIGKIKRYSIIINSMKFFTVPVSWIILSVFRKIEFVFIVFTFFELLCSILRIFVLKYEGGLVVCDYIKHVFMRELIPILILLSAVILCYLYIPCDYFYVTYFVSFLLFVISIYKWGLTSFEMNVIKSLLKRTL